MNCLMLIGAGFSRNWGGWLADEVYDYLIGVRELDDTCRQLLTSHRAAGFEKALGILQADSSPAARNAGTPLRLMEAAIEQMFTDMGRAWFRTGWDMEFMSPPQTGRSNIKEFLARFDAIFTLNQDLLLEIGYCQRAEPMQAFNPRWHALEFPAMVTRVPNPLTPASRWVGSRCPASRDVQSVTPTDSHTQPIYKLHGSSNWVDETGEQLQILGDDKAATIAASRVLSLYKEEFHRRLRLPDTRLMIIGYGFHDGHIDASINEAISRGNLRAFIIDPAGADAPDPYRNRPYRIKSVEPEYPVQRVLMGVSKRPLSSTFGGDTIELDKVWRFFDP
jgi:SIR2-like domain